MIQSQKWWGLFSCTFIQEFFVESCKHADKQTDTQLKGHFKVPFYLVEVSFFLCVYSFMVPRFSDIIQCCRLMRPVNPCFSEVVGL